jgi:Fe-S cluster assembly protein SufD
VNAPQSPAVIGFLARFADSAGGAGNDDRSAAADLLAQKGMPTRTSEAWKYTSLRAVSDIAWQAPPENGRLPPTLAARMPDFEGPRVVMLNGRPYGDAPVLPLGCTAFDAPARGPSDAERISLRGQPMVALNTLLSHPGLRLSVQAGADCGTILFVNFGHAETAISFHPRHEIQLGRGAQLTLIELNIGDGPYFHNPMFDILLDNDAKFTHIRLQNESSDAVHISHLHVEAAAGSAYESFVMNIGGALLRTEADVRLNGRGAMVALNGAQLLGGRQHADFTSNIVHDAPACASRQTVKTVLSGHARGVFQGRIAVARAAQKTDGYQMNHALLLSPDAEMDSKPELRIFADDVKCSHGATVGELDAEQLFYLRSRGLDEAAARAMLVRAFLDGALEAIADPLARGMVDDAVQAWWQEQTI